MCLGQHGFVKQTKTNVSDDNSEGAPTNINITGRVTKQLVAIMLFCFGSYEKQEDATSVHHCFVYVFALAVKLLLCFLCCGYFAYMKCHCHCISCLLK